MPLTLTITLTVSGKNRVGNELMKTCFALVEFKLGQVCRVNLGYFWTFKVNDHLWQDSHIFPYFTMLMPLVTTKNKAFLWTKDPNDLKAQTGVMPQQHNYSDSSC